MLNAKLMGNVQNKSSFLSLTISLKCTWIGKLFAFMKMYQALKMTFYSLFKLLIQQPFNEHSGEPATLLGAQNSVVNKNQKAHSNSSNLR